MTVSKDQISIAKAVAILFMFAHHLFAFPDRIPAGTELLSATLSPSLATEFEIGVFGKVCVGMFICASGLGLGLRRRNWSLWEVPGRLIPFYSTFLANFIILIAASVFIFPDGRAIGHWKGIDPGIGEFLANIFLVKPSYSMEWWFARLYVIIIIIAWPMCELTLRAGPGVLLLVSFALFSASRALSSPDNFLFYQLVFTLGFLAGRREGGPPGPAFTRRRRLFLLCAGVFALSMLARPLFGMAWEAVLAPLCVWAAVWLPAEGVFRKTLVVLGNHSASMWLNHTFICYYWFNEEFYSVRYTPALLILLVLSSLLLSLATSPAIRLTRRLMEWAARQLRFVGFPPAQDRAAER